MIVNSSQTFQAQTMYFLQRSIRLQNAQTYSFGRQSFEQYINVRINLSSRGRHSGRQIKKAKQVYASVKQYLQWDCLEANTTNIRSWRMRLCGHFHASSFYKSWYTKTGSLRTL